MPATSVAILERFGGRGDGTIGVHIRNLVDDSVADTLSRQSLSRSPLMVNGLLRLNGIVMDEERTVKLAVYLYLYVRETIPGIPRYFVSQLGHGGRKA